LISFYWHDAIYKIFRHDSRDFQLLLAYNSLPPHARRPPSREIFARCGLRRKHTAAHRLLPVCCRYRLFEVTSQMPPVLSICRPSNAGGRNLLLISRASHAFIIDYLLDKETLIRE